MANTTNFNWETPDDTDLVKDGAAAIRTLGSSIDTSFVDLKGGTTGQILSKASNTDLDYTWITNDVGDITEVQAGVGISIASGTGPIPVITNSSTDLITTAGDLLYGTAADTVARLGIGTAGQVLKVNSGATAPEWGTVSGGGKVLQVVTGTTTTEVSNSTTTLSDTTLTATITPTSASSTILVMVHQNGATKTAANAGNGIVISLRRGANEIALVAFAALYTNSTLVQQGTTASIAYLDSPATTSATTYKTQFRNRITAAEVTVQSNNPVSTITLFEIGA